MFVDFLDRLVRSIPGRKIHLICDNHSAHHAKLVKAWAAKHADRIELHFLPGGRRCARCLAAGTGRSA